MKKGAAPARQAIQLNKRVFVFIVCLGISLFAWLQINLSKKQIDSIPVRLEFTNLPKQRFHETVHSDTLLVEVEADGYDLLQYEMQEVKVEYKRLRRSSDGHHWYFLPNSSLKSIARQLGDEFRVVRALSDTVVIIPSQR